jgi:molecular chaperone DnaK
MESAQKLFAKVYEQAQGAAGAEGAGPDMGGAADSAGQDDDVVDGDYREV